MKKSVLKRTIVLVLLFVLSLPKRLITLALIVIAFALLLIPCIIIRMESKGWPLFLQKRMGKDGKMFTIYKLRTMRVHTLPDGYHATCTEQRRMEYLHVTKFGAWLRRCSIDEVPQLLNVLIGNMAFVGPRPLALSNIKAGQFYAPRDCDVLPGITGAWQTSSPHLSDVDTKEQYERDYCQNKSLLIDTRIIVRTPAYIFTKKYSKDLY